MAQLSPTRALPRPGRAAPRRTRAWPAALFAALIGLTVAGVLVYPTYPNYDSYYALLWGRELLHGVTPTFEAYRAPTEHPLTIAFGAGLSVAGLDADRLMVAATFASFLALVAAMYRLARASFGMLAGVVAAAILCTRFDLPFLAARAYVDIPYLALLLWAAVLEAERPRRGLPVLAMIAVAGLMRPDAWVASGAYVLWVWGGASPRRRAGYVALAAAGPLAWAAVDLAVTGDPLFSLSHTSTLAEDLGRSAGLGELPAATVRFLVGLDKLPILAAGVLGIVLTPVLGRARVRVPAALLGLGLATFAAVTAVGASVVFRYLLVPSLMLVLFAAVPVAGWTLLPAGTRARRCWAAAAAVAVAAGAAFTVTHTTPSTFAAELRFRGRSHAALRALVDDPRVVAARACGPISVPNHKLIPELRWIARAPAGAVVARSDRATRERTRRGVALYATSRLTLLRYGYSPDSYRNAIPMRGFRLLAANGYYAAWGRC
ncbi:hypothetical protein [Candidatus Solirubrobacter pratensis]|uniref:hypothetical protein n=1 Tax=Candidatus Solirubrobacter pratensis TaxID=1298857 RepID=UPI0004262801|nr:hypothetical protein [Candidatus Solirubrobacter pratensis]